MKKSIALLALAFGVTGAFAQDLTSKKGEPILPEAEDWALSVDATPFLKYAGNFIGGNGLNAAPTWDNYGANNTIMVKKFIDAKSAYRATFRIGLRNQSWKNDVLQPVASTSTTVYFPTAATKVTDKASHSSTFIGLGVGKEIRRGKTRLQGFYGADIFIWYSSSKDKFKYANNLTQQVVGGTTDPDVDPTNPNYNTNWNVVSPANFATSNLGASIPNIAGVTGYRKLSEKSGGQFGLGVRAFIGAEYFFMPKISIGGEFGWGLGVAMNMKSKTVYEAEGNDSAGNEQKSEITVTQKQGMQLILDTDNNPANRSNYNLALSPTGTLRLNLHF